MGTAIFRLQEHTERLFNSAHIYMMKMPYDKETLIEAQKEVVRANKLDACYMRPIAFYGSEKMGVSPKGAHGARRDRRLAVGRLSRRRRHRERHPREDRPRTRGITSTSPCAAPSSPAPMPTRSSPTRRRLEHGYDEGAAARRGRLRRRGLGREPVHRQERQAVRAGAHLRADRHYARRSDHHGARHRARGARRAVTRDDVYIADEAFFTGTAAEVTPIRELDSRLIGTGERGPITEKLQTMFFDIVNGRSRSTSIGSPTFDLPLSATIMESKAEPTSGTSKSPQPICRCTVRCPRCCCGTRIRACSCRSRRPARRCAVLRHALHAEGRCARRRSIDGAGAHGDAARTALHNILVIGPSWVGDTHPRAAAAAPAATSSTPTRSSTCSRPHGRCRCSRACRRSRTASRSPFAHGELKSASAAGASRVSCARAATIRRSCCPTRSSLR